MLYETCSVEVSVRFGNVMYAACIDNSQCDVNAAFVG